jgi:hypothetical protein
MTTRISKETHAKVEAVWPDILNGLAAGESPREVYAKFGLTYDMMRGYRDNVEGARVAWQTARKDSAQALVDKALQLVADLMSNNSDVDPARARVALDSFRFFIERLDPESFAPRTKADINVRHVDLTAIIAAAQKRVAMRDARLIGGSSTIDSERSHTSHVLDSMVLANLM